MRNLYLTAFILAICCFIAGLPRAAAQGFNNTNTNAIYAEVGGQGVFFSVNYDARLTSREIGRAHV